MNNNSNKDLIAKFESYLLTERRVAHNTFQAYQRDLEQLAHFLKERLVTFDKTTLQDLKDFLKVLKEDGLKAKSMARKISCFKTFFLYLNQYFDISNPAEQLISPKLESKLPQYLSEKEIELLLKAADSEITAIGFRNKVMLYLLYVTGMRISELTHLKVTQLDFSSGFIVISGKGGKERMVPVPQHMLTLLGNYLNQVYPLLINKDSATATDYLFPSYYGKKLQALTRQSFFMYLKDLTIKAGIKKELSPHQLRHSLATHLLKKGANLRSLQMLLGHEQIATVQIYTHIETSHLRKIYDDKHPRS
jgi:integrase/recombinase XerD